MKQCERGTSRLTRACPARHLELRLDQMRNRSGDTAMAITQQTAMRIERQSAVDIEPAVASTGTGFGAGDEADLLEQYGESDREAVVYGSIIGVGDCNTRNASSPSYRGGGAE